MNKQYAIVFTSIIFAACNANNTTAVNTDTTVGTTDSSSNKMMIQVPSATCYSNITGKDSVYLKLEKFPNVVTGNLKYKLYEKDSNTGSIDGKMNGDTLIADYTFISEGQKSVRQVAFLVKDDIVTEGYADMEEKAGKMIFKNTNKLDFSKGLQLKKVDCPVE